MLLEAILSILIISGTTLGSLNIISSARLKTATQLKQHEAAWVAQSELERVLAARRDASAWFWAAVCLNNTPCFTERRPQAWHLARGTRTYADYTIASWFEDNVGKTERKIVVEVSWSENGGGSIRREVLVTNP